MVGPVRADGVKVLVIANDGDAFLRHRLGVVERLASLGADVVVMAGGSAPPPSRIAGWRFRHTAIDRLSISPLNNLLLFARLAEAIDEFDPEIVHLITLKPAVLGGIAAARRARRTGRPTRILITIPGLGRLMSPHGLGVGIATYPVRKAVSLVIRWLSRQPQVSFSFETVGDRQHWIDQGLIREDNSHVVNGAGVDPEKFYPAAATGQRTRLRFLFASRLLRSKGLDDFLSAAREFAGRADFIVAGWNDPRDADDFPAEELERETAITFLGPVEDMPELLRSVDVVCLPTRYGEGIPRILIEAAATGLACVASEQSGTRMIVRDGRTGILLKSPQSIATELAAAIGAYIADPGLARIHGEAALLHFHDAGFDERAVVSHFVKLLGVEEGSPVS